jgi:hypothetical protein
VLDYPQSGERIRGRHHIHESRTAQPNKKRFMIRRMIGSGDLWVTEFILTYDGLPFYACNSSKDWLLTKHNILPIGLTY